MNKQIKMENIRKLWVKLSLVILVISIIFVIFDDTFSRYHISLINDSDLSLAPWVISINNQKVTSAGVVDVVVEPVITEVTTDTKTYNNKVVPGCKGYFDIEINPTGTGVSIDYIIDFNPNSLPGGMVYTKYQSIDENGTVVGPLNNLPSDLKLTGTLSLVNGVLMGPENILKYRIYWDYVDDDTLNTTAPNVDNQNSILINVTLKQSI